MVAEGQRTILGFDYGLKRIGVALGMEITRTARPLTIVACHDGKPVWESISALIEEWHPDLLVVGLPVTLEGNQQEMTDCSRSFGRKLSGRYNLPVQHVDERLTTVEAKSRLAGQGNPAEEVDHVAAQIILEGWFTENRTHKHPISKNND
ncbi:MAG: Holliday junction resolvase RuvX [Gammaproteobacteria bacterium]|nr:MAG: Holliday junction resolvase RuvX [Gammaproteobacteria bacterium]